MFVKLEEQTGEGPMQMEDQTEKPEPEKITGSIDMNAIMVMLQRMKEDNNKNRREAVSYTHLEDVYKRQESNHSDFM